MSQVNLFPSEHISPSVSLCSGRPATTSLEVAKFFGKRHDDIIRSIRNLRSNCPEEFTARNFAASEYTDETGRKLPLFILYRDGFMLLVMGYTGKKALAMKLAYIEAFNLMEEKLARQNLSPAAPAAPRSITPSTSEDRKPLRALVGSWAQVAGLPFAACWNQLKAAFNIADIRDLPQEWMPDAVAWVQGRLDALPAPALPAPASTASHTALPAAAPAAPADDAEGHLAAIREHVRHIYRHEEALFQMGRKALPPVRKPQDMVSPARHAWLAILSSMEDSCGVLSSALRALESATRAMLARRNVA